MFIPELENGRVNSKSTSTHQTTGFHALHHRLQRPLRLRRRDSRMLMSELDEVYVTTATFSKVIERRELDEV